MVYLRADSINVYTDGSQKQKPRRGGFGIIYVTEDTAGNEVIDDFVRVGWDGASNQQMEMWAVIAALRELASKQYSPIEISRFRRITIYTDSQYVLDGYENARRSWQDNGWVNRHGRTVSNSRLWELFLEAVKRAPLPVYFEKVKAHGENKHNRLADLQARASADKAGPRLPGAAIVRRKRSSRQVKEGSIRPTGQTELINVITAYSDKARAQKFKIEVVDEESPDFEKVDFAYTELPLRPNHVYRVVYGDDPNNPRLEVLIEEVPRDEVFTDDEEEA